MSAKGSKWRLCGYCPSKVRMDPGGPVLPSSRGDVPYAEHAAMHEAFGPAISHTFRRSPDGQPRALREIPARGRGFADDDAPLFQESAGWD